MKISLINGSGAIQYLDGLLSGLSKITDLSINLVDSDICEGRYNDIPNVRLINIRGNQDFNVPFFKKFKRIFKFYFKLLLYTTKTDTKIFHIQWYNRFDIIDRTIINIIYKLFGKKIIFTAHNINKAKRDNKDNILNRLALKIHYKLVHSIIVHTDLMKKELITDFKIRDEKIHVIPHGIIKTDYVTDLNKEEARKKLMIKKDKKVLLFFGNIDFYKGLDILLKAFEKFNPDEYTLIIAGSVRNNFKESFYKEIKPFLNKENIISKIEFIPDEDMEIYFKAADCLVLPYKNISQTGLIFLSYQFGLPIIASNVGNFKNDVQEGTTGYICLENNPYQLWKTIELYFNSDLYKNLPCKMKEISEWANDKYSWDKIGITTFELYKKILKQT